MKIEAISVCLKVQLAISQRFNNLKIFIKLKEGIKGSQVVFLAVLFLVNVLGMFSLTSANNNGKFLTEEQKSVKVLGTVDPGYTIPRQFSQSICVPSLLTNISGGFHQFLKGAAVPTPKNNC